ncbi:sugar porter family MFS transporter [uncultured Shewanella sp.]|uniref:sugar porter family MFS transporter n=1 Tax=uncultured Shewanella sp. TaxID=173975 RepID=UPI00260AB2B3|nr:sugar porter family MFS transporter [uncultured Shewanella sp.]
MMFGCAIGAFYAGRLADIYGRRFMMRVISVLFILSSFGVGFVDSASLFIFYRVIGGVCVGAISILVPMYIAEVSAALYRGRLGAIQNMMVILGLCAAFLSNFLLTELSGGSLVVFWFGFETWRWMLWGELLPAILFFIMLFFVPESPRYLVIAGKNAKASQVLTRLFGQLAGEAKLMEIVFSLTGQDQPKLTDLKNKRTGKVQHVLWIGIGLAAFQQLIGINIFYYYGVMMFESLGFNESDAIFINVLGAIFSFVASIIAMLFIDKWGRKKLLLIGSIGIFSCLLCLSFTLFQIDKGAVLPFLGSLAYTHLAVLLVYLYLIFFNISWGPVMWVMLGEIFPNQIRGSGLAVAVLSALAH